MSIYILRMTYTVIGHDRLGLETLKLLEALDLSNNLIRTHDDMRALSFNGKLLSLRLEGAADSHDTCIV